MKKNNFEHLSQALTKDGFELSNIDSKLIAKKNETKLVINKYQEIEFRNDYFYILGLLPNKANSVSGIAFSEVKKLLKYEKKNTKSLFETFIKMCDKYMWHNSFFSDYDLDNHSEIKYIEVITDTEEHYTFVFIKDEFNENFMVFKTKSRDFIKQLQNIKIVHQDLQTVAPNLRKII